MDTIALIDALQRFRNVVLEGVPGVGKTYAIGKVAKAWKSATGRPLKGDGKGDWAITLHPSTAYEDFVEGLRADVTSSNANPELGVLRASSNGKTPDEPAPEQVSGWFDQEPTSGGNFVPRNGFFLRACKQAVAHPHDDFLVLLDELNRANVPKVMGDLLTTIEHSKRATWSEEHQAWDLRKAAVVALPYMARPFFVPDNVYVLATLNSSDRSVTGLDAALRRRFAFVRLEPKADLELYSEVWKHFVKTFKKRHGKIQSDTIRASARKKTYPPLEKSIQAWHQLNENALRPLLGPDAVLGHSTFFSMAERMVDSSQMRLLHWKDRPDIHQVRNWLDAGKSSTGTPIRRAFWLKLGKTGGSDDQADLPKNSKRKRLPGGQASLVFGKPPEGGPFNIEVLFEGQERTTELTYRNGNGMWRWNKLPSGIADHVVLCLETSPLVLELHRLTPDDIPALKEISTWDVTTSGKHFGDLHAAIAKHQTIPNAIRSTWRFEILPQLVDTLLGHGAELLLDKHRRKDWIEDLQPAPSEQERADALSTLGNLDHYLQEMGIQIRVSGRGIGRAPEILDKPSELTASGNEE